MNVNIKVKKRFENEFLNNVFYKDIMKNYPALKDKIKNEMQHMYDLGHADGYADCVFENM